MSRYLKSNAIVNTMSLIFSFRNLVDPIYLLRNISSVFLVDLFASKQHIDDYYCSLFNSMSLKKNTLPPKLPFPIIIKSKQMLIQLCNTNEHLIDQIQSKLNTQNSPLSFSVRCMRTLQGLQSVLCDSDKFLTWSMFEGFKVDLDDFIF